MVITKKNITISIIFFLGIILVFYKYILADLKGPDEIFFLSENNSENVKFKYSLFGYIVKSFYNVNKLLWPFLMLTLFTYCLNKITNTKFLIFFSPILIYYIISYNRDGLVFILIMWYLYKQKNRYLILASLLRPELLIIFISKYLLKYFKILKYPLLTLLLLIFGSYFIINSFEGISELYFFIQNKYEDDNTGFGIFLNEFWFYGFITNLILYTAAGFFHVQGGMFIYLYYFHSLILTYIVLKYFRSIFYSNSIILEIIPVIIIYALVESGIGALIKHSLILIPYIYFSIIRHNEIKLTRNIAS
jgi:hypothetical protein